MPAGRVRAWRCAPLIVQPATLLRWHRAGFRALWRANSHPGPGRPPLAPEPIALIRRMATEHPPWGAGRIRGDLGKLGVRVAKRAIPTYLPGATSPRPHGQAWAASLRHHAGAIWACDVLPVVDPRFRPPCAFFTIELATRWVVHVGATRRPTDAWAAQPLRAAAPCDQRPPYLIRDNGAKYRVAFARPPYRAPQANAVCQRSLGGVRRACLDHLLTLGGRRPSRVLRGYVASYNRARPQQGVGQEFPESPPGELARHAGPIKAIPVLGGRHHTCRRAA